MTWTSCVHAKPLRSGSSRRHDARSLSYPGRADTIGMSTQILLVGIALGAGLFHDGYTLMPGFRALFPRRVLPYARNALVPAMVSLTLVIDTGYVIAGRASHGKPFVPIDPLSREIGGRSSRA